MDGVASPDTWSERVRCRAPSEYSDKPMSEDSLTLEPLTIPTRSIEGYHPCNTCKGLAPPGERTCGRCPQRRASDSEIQDSTVVIGEGDDMTTVVNLPQCRRDTCRRYLYPSKTNPPRYLATEPGVLCYECHRDSSGRTVKCACRNHRGDKPVPVELTDQFAMTSTAKRTFGDVYFGSVCYACALKYSLQTREQWLFDHGDVNPETGECIPALQQTGELTIQGDPLSGLGPVWHPVEALYTRDGTTHAHEAIVEPIRYIYWRRGNNPCRAILGDYYADGSRERARGIVWLPSLNAECDRITDLGNGRKRSPVHSVGLLYVRCVARATSTLGAYVVLRKHHPDLSPSEWLQYCRETGE